MENVAENKPKKSLLSEASVPDPDNAGVGTEGTNRWFDTPSYRYSF